MVNKNFNCINLIKTCINNLKLQAKKKKVSIIGPIFESPLDRFYFYQLYTDKRHYGQLIFSFLSNSIKFTPEGGKVTIALKILSIEDFDSKNIHSQQVYLVSPRFSQHEHSSSAPDKEVPDKSSSSNLSKSQKIE